MAGKRTLNAKNLETLGAAALAELLIEVSTGNAVVQRRLRLALASADGVEGVVQEVRKRLAAIARATTFVDSRKRKALLADLEAQRQAILGPIAAGDPRQALELLQRFLELGDGVLQRCSDTTGAVVGVFQGAAADLATLARMAGATPEALAEQVAELLAENSYGQFDGLIPSLGPVLGDRGLRHLKTTLLEHGGVDRFTAQQIAQAMGDVEAYLAMFDESQLSWPDTAAAVAQYLLASGRPEQALAVLERAAGGAATWHAPEWDDAHIAVLEALARPEEAQQERWRCFCKMLSIPHLRAYLKGLDDFADVEAEERALAVAEAHHLPLLALQFLVNWPALPRAARYVIDRWEEWDGAAYEIYAPAAERLSADYPVAATLLLRAMVAFALDTGRSNRYRYAAEHLRTCELLDARIDDWQGVETHTSFAGRLRETYSGSWGFWKLLER